MGACTCTNNTEAGPSSRRQQHEPLRLQQQPQPQSQLPHHATAAHRQPEPPLQLRQMPCLSQQPQEGSHNKPKPPVPSIECSPVSLAQCEGSTIDFQLLSPLQALPPPAHKEEKLAQSSARLIKPTRDVPSEHFRDEQPHIRTTGLSQHRLTDTIHSPTLFETPRRAAAGAGTPGTELTESWSGEFQAVQLHGALVCDRAVDAPNPGSSPGSRRTTALHMLEQDLIEVAPKAGHSARLADSPKMKQMPLLPWLRPAAVSSSPALQRGLCSLNRCSGSTEKLRSVHNQAAGTNGTRNRGVSAESGSESASPSESQDNSAERTNRLNRRRRSRGKKPSAGVLEWSTEAGFIEGESESSGEHLEGSGSLGEMASNEDLVHERFGTHHVELDSIQQISLISKFQHDNEANASLQQDHSGQSSDTQSGETSMGTREMQPTNIREREWRSDMRESYTPMINVAIAVDDVIINDS